MLTTTLQSIREFFDLSSDGIAFAAPDPWRFVYVNAKLAEWAGRPMSERAIEEVLSGITPGQILDRLEQVWRGEAVNSVVPAGWLHRRDNLSDVPVEIRVVCVQFAEQRLVGLVICKADVSKAKATAGRRDPLTGLADRSELLARLGALLDGERSADQRICVLFIDLNHFKEVNDRYGHLVGDYALVEVAQRLVQCTRVSDQIFRYGGDEFVVLVEQVAGENEIEQVVARIHAELAQPIMIRDEEVRVSASVGAAEVSAAHRTPEDVLIEADRAMYAAKRLVPLRVRH